MLDVLDLMYLNAMSRFALAKKRIRENARRLWEDEKGSTSAIVIDIVLIGMVLVLAFVFRKQIGGLFADLWNSLVKFKENSDPPTIESMSNPFG